MEMEKQASKKRKVISQDMDMDMDEDKEIEEFFALVRRIREARDRLNINSKSNEEDCTELKTKKVDEAWKPTFLREDFLIQDDPPPPLPVSTTTTTSPPPPSSSSSHHQNPPDQISLDLTLSL